MGNEVKNQGEGSRKESEVKGEPRREVVNSDSGCCQIRIEVICCRPEDGSSCC